MDKKQEGKSGKVSYIAITAALLCVLGVGYTLYQRPQLLQGKEISESAEIATLKNKILQLEGQIQNLQSHTSEVRLQDVVALNEKVDQNQKLNLEMLSSKADVMALMGSIERLDRVEGRLSEVSKATSQGALILTAAILTEDVARSGEPFVYEASVLQELSSGTKMEASADIIASYALKGLPSKNDLIKRFNNLYETSFAKKEVSEPKDVSATPLDWKDKIINKLRSLIVIEIIEKDDQKIEKKSAEDKVYQLVQAGEFEAAALKMNTDTKYQTEAFQIWIEDVRAEKVFNAQINKIKALTLGLMKAENLKQGVIER